MGQKRAMILGAAAGQVPFISICKQLGCFVIAVSPKGDYPGFEIADKALYLDTRDKEAILKAAKEENIDFITTDQTDVSVPAVAYVSEKLGLPGIGYELSRTFTDKYLMRRKAKAIGIPVPEFFLARTYNDIIENIDRLSFPVIVKPTNSSGSRGVCRVDETEGLRAAFDNASAFSGNSEVIVEEFIEGREYLADGFAMNGQYITTDFGVKEYFDIPNTYISKMCMFSSASLADNDVEKDVVLTNTRLVKGMGIPFGITHAEYIHSAKDGKVYLVEIAARGGGVNLSSDITPEASGVNTNRLLLEYLVNGQTVNLEKIKLRKRVCAWRCFELVPGEIVHISGEDDVRRIDGVMKCCTESLYIGKKIEPLINDTFKHGPILASGENTEECFAVFDKAKDALDIRTRDENGVIHNIKW